MTQSAKICVAVEDGMQRGSEMLRPRHDVRDVGAQLIARRFFPAAERIAREDAAALTLPVGAVPAVDGARALSLDAGALLCAMPRTEALGREVDAARLRALLARTRGHQALCRRLHVRAAMRTRAHGGSMTDDGS